MGFLQIANSWLFIIPVIVILYYFFRRKYKRQTVASTLFWEEAMEETKASPYIKKLQKNSLLFLQLAALIFMILALMNPYIKSIQSTDEQMIIIFDTSASMEAGNGKSLFEQHKEQAKEMIASLNGEPVTIITTGNQPTIVVKDETSRRILSDAIDDLTINYETEAMKQSFIVAQSLIGTKPTSVYIYSENIERSELPIQNQNVRWVVEGRKDDVKNIAISKFSAMDLNGEKTMLLQLDNQMNEDKKVKIVLRDENGHSLSEIVTVVANEETPFLFTSNELSTYISAKIEVEDFYTLDNIAYTVVEKPAIQVRLDPATHNLVQKGFAAVYDDVVYIDAASQANKNEVGLVVTNDTTRLSEENPVLLFGRNDVQAKEVNAFVTSSTDALFSFSPLDEVYVQALYPPIEGAITIATLGEEPFIQRTNKGDLIVLTDIAATDWALQPTFPLFLWSVIQDVATQSSYLGQFSPNEQQPIILAEGEWSIFDMEDHFIKALSNPRQFSAPSKPGFYVLKKENETNTMTVNLSKEEKIIAKGSNYTIGQTIEKTSESKSSLMLLFIPFILLLLLLEWEVQRRRGFTN